AGRERTVSGQAGRRFGDAFVGRGEGDADVFGGTGAVEVAGGGEDASVGEPLEGAAAGFAAGGPEVEARGGVVDAETGGQQGFSQDVAAGAVAFALLGLVGVVAQGGGHGGLDGERQHHAGVL